MRTTEASATVSRLADQGHLIGEALAGRGRGGHLHDHRYAATGQVQAEVGLAGATDVDDAVAAARAAQPAWAALSPTRRAGHPVPPGRPARAATRDEAAELGALDNGTPVSVMQPGRYTAAWVRYYAGWCDKLDGEALVVRADGHLRPARALRGGRR